MSYTPTLQDSCTDFLRAVNASMGNQGLESETAQTFITHGKKIVELFEGSIPKSKRRVINDCLNKAQDTNRVLWQRQEKLLMLSSLLR